MRHAERLARGVHHRNLFGELVGHRRAIGLVVGREIVAKRSAGQIERGRDVLRLVLVEQLAEHRHEDVDGVGRTALGISQQAAFRRPNRRVIRAVHLRAAVDEIDRGFQRSSEGNGCREICNISFGGYAERDRRGARRAGSPGSRGVGVQRRGDGSGGGFFRQYQYEEEVYLSLDGTATVYVNASLAALNALRGTSFATAPNAPLDREAVRAFFSTPGDARRRRRSTPRAGATAGSST